jgi:RNA polymerase sigma factor (sigma-70 family)
MDAESSIELLRLARSGDQHALDSLLRRYLPALRRWAHGRLPRWARDIAETEDLVQESVAETLKHLARIDVERDGALHAYLRQAVMNRIRNELRRAARHPRQVELDPETPLTSLSPLEIAIGSETLARYESALGRLSSTEREAIIGRLELGLSFDELAHALDKPSPDAARLTVTRAVVRLTKLMADADPASSTP